MARRRFAGARCGDVALSLLTVLLVVWGVTRTLKLGDHLILDEKGFCAQIRLFVEGRFELYRAPGQEHPYSAMLPGFHAVMAGVARLTGQDSLMALRAYCLAFSFVLAIVAYALARKIVGREYAVVRAAQAYVMPLAFPFYFLVYTDVFSLLLEMVAFLATVHRRWALFGIVASLAILVRQTNVVFLVFLIAYAYVETNDWKFDLSRIVQHLLRCWTAVVGLLAFSVFVLIHGRVGLDAPAYHPLTISVGNVLVSLICCAAVFLPVHLGNLVRFIHARWIERSEPNALASDALPEPTLAEGPVASAVGLSVGFSKKRATLITVIAVVASIVLLCLMWYEPVHPWNDMEGLLRNRGLDLLTYSNGTRLLFAAVVVGAVLSLAITPLAKPAALWVYPFWLLRLAPVVLIEPRYYLEIFVLLVLLRAPDRRGVEYGLWAWFCLIAAGLHYGVTERIFLP